LKTVVALQRFPPSFNLWLGRRRRSYVLSKTVAEVRRERLAAKKFAFPEKLAQDLGIQRAP
jgi:hypothetical protein